MQMNKNTKKSFIGFVVSSASWGKRDMEIAFSAIGAYALSSFMGYLCYSGIVQTGSTLKFFVLGQIGQYTVQA